MKQVAPLSFRPFVFLFLSIALGILRWFPIGMGIFAWMGAIQLVNALAPKLPCSRFFHWLHAITFELPALLGVACLRFVPLIKNKIPGTGRPILLVHGYVNHGAVWLFFRPWLKAHGLGPIYTIDLGCPFHSIRAHAEKVKTMAEQIAKETGREDLVLIGHSMGGLVSSLYATLLAPSRTVTDVITIGSPLHGTRVAHIGIGQNAKEMRPTSLLLQEIRDAMRQNKEIRFFHLATKSDSLVIPSESAILSENASFVFEDLGHASLLYSKRACNQVASWIKDTQEISA